jgi:hypothetical protein
LRKSSLHPPSEKKRPNHGKQNIESTHIIADKAGICQDKKAFLCLVWASAFLLAGSPFKGLGLLLKTARKHIENLRWELWVLYPYIKEPPVI